MEVDQPLDQRNGLHGLALHSFVDARVIAKPLSSSDNYEARKRQRAVTTEVDSLTMSDYYFPPYHLPEEEDELDLNTLFGEQTPLPQREIQTLYATQPAANTAEQHQVFDVEPQYRPQLQGSYEFYTPFSMRAAQHPDWIMQTPVVPSNFPAQQSSASVPRYTDSFQFSHEMVTAGPSMPVAGFLLPMETSQTRPSRAASFASNASSVPSVSASDSRSASPSANEMAKWGYRHENGAWTCAYPGCTSKSIFNRGCDLRKHYKRHTKNLFCRHEGCPQATEGGFSSKKDRARHEAKHNPNVVCEWDGCDRLFSRPDNMKDHVKRVHQRKLTEQPDIR